MKKYLIFASIVSLIISCGKDDEKNITKLEYVKTIALYEPELENFQRITVFDDGSILLNMHGPALNAISHVYRYSADGTYLGQFLDRTADSADITFYNFFQDANQNVKFIALQNYDTPQIREYQIDGTFVSAIPIIVNESTDNYLSFFYGHWAFDIDEDKNFFTVSSDMAGEYNVMAEFSANLNTVYNHLEVDDIEQLFPGQNGEQIRLTDIAVHNDRIYITIDRIAEDEDKDKDGVLILDKDFNRIDFFGEDWMFNGPGSICFDGNYMYVLDNYSKEIKVFNEDLDQVGGFSNTSDNFIIDNPIALTVKGDYVYEVDYNDGAKQINIFNKLK